MKESMWGVFIIMLGALGITFIFFFQSITNTEEHNYALIKETAEAAMYDAVDESFKTQHGVLRINQEKFVENFVRRFAQNAVVANTYKIEIMDINEIPPKVSLRVRTKLSTGIGGQSHDYDIVNTIDAVLETKN